MAGITSAGAGSGIDLEAVIAASVNAKKAQLEQPLIKKETNAKVSLSGIGQLRSAVSAYVSTLKDMVKSDGFNKRLISISQNKDDPVLKLESKAGMSNGQYNITVNKLATTSKFESIFNSTTDAIVTEDGTLTFTAGSKSFTVDVKVGDNLQNIRKRINNDGDSFGLSVNIITTSDGKSKLIMDSGVSGDGNNMTMTGSTAELASFASSFEQKQVSASAEIDVDGNKLSSDTNVFDGTIMGVKLTVLRTSDKDSLNAFKPNKVSISTDKDGVKEVIKGFIDGYNALVSKAKELGKRNAIVDGEKKNDGGALAGDSMPRAIVNMMNSIVATQSSNTGGPSTIFQAGIKMDRKGVLSLDDEKFKDAISKNYEQVISLFSGDSGVAKSLTEQLDVYSRSGGVLATREERVNKELREVGASKSDATKEIKKYEEKLRGRYGALDALITKLNKSASYLNMLKTR
ncbi:MAG: flagellar filament capping protein FliD [Aeromonas sp.]